MARKFGVLILMVLIMMMKIKRWNNVGECCARIVVLILICISLNQQEGISCATRVEVVDIVRFSANHNCRGCAPVGVAFSEAQTDFT